MLSSPLPLSSNLDQAHPAHALLSRAHSPDTASALFASKIQHRPLLLRKTSPSPPANARTQRREERLAKQRAQLKRRNKSKPPPLSAKEKRKLCVHDIPKEEAQWSLLEGLRNLWAGYVREILGVGSDDGENGEVEKKVAYVTPASAGPILAGADLHGAVLTVVRSRCVTRVGVRGTVVQDRKFVVVLVTEKNEVKTIPKEHTIFRFEVPLLPVHGGEVAPRPLVLEINGEQFQNRAPDRAVKKFKIHYQADM